MSCLLFKSAHERNSTILISVNYFSHYHLLASSQAIDSGENFAPDLPAHDIEGEDRIQDDTVDMGAYELPGTPGVGGGGTEPEVEGVEGCSIATEAY